jgi:hypothetical protein
MLCWLRQQLGQNVFEMISLLGFNMEFIMSLINSLKSSTSKAADASTTLPGTEVSIF